MASPRRTAARSTWEASLAAREDGRRHDDSERSNGQLSEPRARRTLKHLHRRRTNAIVRRQDGLRASHRVVRDRRVHRPRMFRRGGAFPFVMSRRLNWRHGFRKPVQLPASEAPCHRSCGHVVCRRYRRRELLGTKPVADDAGAVDPDIRDSPLAPGGHRGVGGVFALAWYRAASPCSAAYHKSDQPVFLTWLSFDRRNPKKFGIICSQSRNR